MYINTEHMCIYIFNILGKTLDRFLNFSRMT